MKASRTHVERLLVHEPTDAEAWNLLAGLRQRSGDPEGAQAALVRSLEADPYSPTALANAGLLAAAAGDRRQAEGLLARLRHINPLGVTPEETALLRALGR